MVRWSALLAMQGDGALVRIANRMEPRCSTAGRQCQSCLLDSQSHGFEYSPSSLRHAFAPHAWPVCLDTSHIVRW
eukprot:82035-Chlamydomonas_euryale.AAC.1